MRADNLRIVTAPRVERAPSIDPDRLDALAVDVRAVRPNLIDGWEATALVESLGYTDGRVQRELGLNDTREAGEYVYSQSSALPRAPEARWTPKTESLQTIVLRSAASTLIYAVPWLAVFVAQTVRPNAMSLPGEVAPSLALALMFSLVASGGFVQAIVRRGEFYVGMRQFGLARHVVDGLFRLGVATTVVAAAAGVVVGWYFELASWASLTLGADAFVVMSVLWMVCATFTIRRQQWRVAVSFAVGFVAFLVARTVGADPLTAQLVAATTLLIAAIIQSRGVFADGGGLKARTTGVPLPRLSVLVYSTLPYFWYGVAYFSFLFADRLTAGTARATSASASFGIPAPYMMGMELALLTLLVGASGVEVAGALFARAIVKESVRPFHGNSKPLSGTMRRHHAGALALALITFVFAAVAIMSWAPQFLPEGLSQQARTLMLLGDIGYGLLAIGFVNALALFQLRLPWAAVRALTIALFINLVCGYILSHIFGSNYAVAGLIVGGAFFASASTLDVFRSLRHPDYSYALG